MFKELYIAPVLDSSTIHAAILAVCDRRVLIPEEAAIIRNAAKRVIHELGLKRGDAVPDTVTRHNTLQQAVKSVVGTLLSRGSWLPNPQPINAKRTGLVEVVEPFSRLLLAVCEEGPDGPAFRLQKLRLLESMYPFYYWSGKSLAQAKASASSRDMELLSKVSELRERIRRSGDSCIAAKGSMAKVEYRVKGSTTLVPGCDAVLGESVTRAAIAKGAKEAFWDLHWLVRSPNAVIHVKGEDVNKVFPRIDIKVSDFPQEVRMSDPVFLTEEF